MKRTFAVALGLAFGLALAFAASATRNSGGTYSLPGAYNPVVSGAPISSVGFNSTMNDIASELSDSLSRSGKGGMTAPLRVPDGTAAAPTLAFTAQTTTGFYRGGSADLRTSLNGATLWRCTTSGCGPVDTTSGASYYTASISAPVLSASYSAVMPTAVGAGGANTVAVRDASGRLTVADPSASTDAATKAYVDTGSAQWAFTTADQSDSAGALSYQDATGLSFAVVANKDYWFRASIVYTAAASTTGMGIQLTGPASPTQVSAMYQYPKVTTGDVAALGITAFSSGVAPGDTNTSSSRVIAYVDGVIRNGANAGTVQIQFATEVNGSAVTIYQGSSLQWRQLN